VDFARDRGARALEAYPITTTNVILEELHVGTEDVFADAGFGEVGRPTPRRVVVRVDFRSRKRPTGDLSVDADQRRRGLWVDAERDPADQALPQLVGGLRHLHSGLGAVLARYTKSRARGTIAARSER
jgi:hypothetical protein